MRQRKEKGLQSTTWKYLRRSKKKRHNVPDSHRALHMHVLERDFSIRAACVQHDCATCASMQRDAVTAAQSRFLATGFLLFLEQQGEHEYYSLTKNQERTTLPSTTSDRQRARVKRKNVCKSKAWRDGANLKAHIASRAFPREIPVRGRFFFERRFQPLSVGGFFSNQRESISHSPKSPFPSKTQNRQMARTSPWSFFILFVRALGAHPVPGISLIFKRKTQKKIKQSSSSELLSFAPRDCKVHNGTNPSWTMSARRFPLTALNQGVPKRTLRVRWWRALTRVYDVPFWYLPTLDLFPWLWRTPWVKWCLRWLIDVRISRSTQDFPFA